MNTTIFDHSWTNNARGCADQRYFLLCNDSTKTHEDLNRAYDSWQTLADMSMRNRVTNGNLIVLSVNHTFRPL
jgi:hypothetical protein